jgi:predicted permease
VTIFQDLSLAMRRLANAPGKTVSLLLLVAIGIGGNIVILGFVNGFLRRQPAINAARRLVAVYSVDPTGAYSRTTLTDFHALAADSSTFASVAAVKIYNATMTVDGIPQPASVAAVTDGFFDVFADHPVAGREFSAGEAAAARSAVISYSLWQREFSGSTDAIGALLIVGGFPYAIAGVASADLPGLFLGQPVDVWTRLSMPASSSDSDTTPSYFVFARPQPGLAMAAVQSGVETALARADQLRPTAAAAQRSAVIPYSGIEPSATMRVNSIGFALLFASMCVLVLACAGVAGLVLSLSSARAHEFATRHAIGASRATLTRQLINESGLIVCAGATFGSMVAFWTARVLPPLFFPRDYDLLHVAISPATLTLTLLLFLASIVATELAPLLRTDDATSVLLLRQDPAAMATPPIVHRLHASLLTGQMAVCGALIVATTMAAMSVHGAIDDSGRAGSTHILLASLRAQAGEDPDRGLPYLAQLEAHVHRISGVEVTAWTDRPPATLGRQEHLRLLRASQDPNTRAVALETDLVGVSVVSPDYFRLVGATTVAGRVFDETHIVRLLAVVNESFAHRYAGDDIVGHLLLDETNHLIEVMGVVRTNRLSALESPDEPRIYYPLRQRYQGSMTLLARVNGDAERMASLVGASLDVVPGGTLTGPVVSLDQHLQRHLAYERLSIAFMEIGAAMAIVIALIGLHSAAVISVTRRRREIAVRIALGAKAAHIASLVMADTLRLASVGTALGVFGIVIGSVMLSHLGYRSGRPPWIALVVTPASMLFMVAIATASPIRRATRVDPLFLMRGG